MPDLRSLLERESRTVEAPDDFERLVRRRDRRQRNRRIGTAALAIVLAGLAIGVAVRAFEGFERRTPADGSSVAPVVTPLLACPPGSTPNEPGPMDQARPPGRLVQMAFDRGSGRIVVLAPRVDGSSSTWTFDVCSNTWKRMDPPASPTSEAAGWVQLAYDGASARTIATSGFASDVWTYDVDTDQWSRATEVPVDGVFRLVPDPVSGRVLFMSLDHGELWAYDVVADTWTEIQLEGTPLFGATADHNLFAYDASVDRIVMHDGDGGSGWPSGDRTGLLDPRTGVWTPIHTATPEVNTGFIASGGEIAYDEAAERTVVFSDGLVIAFDATAGRWETLDGKEQERCCGYGPQHRLGHWMVYDPLNERLVVYGGQYRTPDGWVKANDVWAFDVATRTWLQLLAPSELPGATD